VYRTPVRIIAGKFRGRQLECPKDVTRPTLDRVREALFSILGDLSGQCVVDLYAGSGALGLEALSRGARHVSLVEADRAAAKVIRKNFASWGVDAQVRVLETTAEHSRSPLAGVKPIDLVLADPPWAIAQEAALIVARAVKGLLASDARIVLGHAAKERLSLLEDSGLVVVDCRTWGDSALSFLTPLPQAVAASATSEAATSAALTAPTTEDKPPS
jgi:16S rRNA (guanine966-N2)-methyltransferase